MHSEPRRHSSTHVRVSSQAAEVFGMPEVKSHLQLFVRTGKKDAKGVLVADEPLPPQRNLTRVRDNDWYVIHYCSDFSFLMQLHCQAWSRRLQAHSDASARSAVQYG